ncbi:ATP-dependent helicase/deoxyribonuclease subunit B [Fundidesulfovibrio magnetotacticus]|uniref:ATP-dependent helicase/deoxyribonuclease subunit B n=1 Tax=Fundidesulfovibrio magnetotacticus TaxID=2730080 RepID=A0A6V8LVJ0_9BACT|nr:PD-(D/E)XK nuclease family protein [Fundidesulfovibrio magnetotacticus]GFK94318.1 ATP-dependent helicase/deoxyribonuclease subunit B [Fundidesulfovibrio magnetotacticus]
MKPVTVVPWDRDFMAGLAAHLRERFQGRFENVLLLFPHRRPKRYLMERLASDERLPKPCLLPRTLSIDELFASLASGLHPEPLRPLSELDRAGVLHGVVTRLGIGPRGSERPFPEAMKDFLPWGLRLARLLEDLFQHGVDADDMDHVQDMAVPTAAALLENLGTIQRAYRRELLDMGGSTPGLLRSLASAKPKEALGALEGSLVLACGFHALSGSEEALLRPLWRADQAEIIWHTDPEVARPGGTPHWSCEAHVRWLKAWKARAVVAEDGSRSPLPSWRTRNDQFSLFAAGGEPEPPRRASVVFHQGFDLHSQLMALRKELDAASDARGYAVVLPDTSMLMPVLHHLPERGVNVSMGYPLGRSPLAQLVETILRLQDGRMPGGYHWREVIALLRHPLLKLLRVGEATPLRVLFHDWEAAIRQGEKYLDPMAWSPQGADPGALALLGRVVEICFTAFEDVQTPRAMAQALSGLASLLLDPLHAGDRWERFVIDAACLARLMDQVIPELHGSTISQESFPPEAVRAMARELLERQRVAFQADPLSGLQVLGMLETRLLTFERVFILGASEEALPGAPKPDPLLPDPLREALGLPAQRERDMAQAHTFYRLIQGAREVGIFYPSGVQPGILDGKSQPSRYVEQLLWEEEKRAGRIIPPGTEPRRLITMPLRGVRPPEPDVENTRACRQKLTTHLRYRGVSPTLLDSFLRCPLAFFFKYLTPLEPLDEVAEEGDPPALGQLVHEVLQDFFRPLLNRPLAPGEPDAARLQALFAEKLAQAPFFRQMPAHARLLLERTGARRLAAFAENSPACTPLELEKRIDAQLDLSGAPCRLSGVIDRLDRREHGLVILDYKTGGPKKPARGFWDDAEVWDAVDAGDVAAGLEMLPELSRKLGSIQLPLYLHALWKATGAEARDAAFVCLGQDGLEVPLFGDKEDADARSLRIQEQTPALAGFVLRMILETPVFTPQPSHACAWCAWSQACTASGAD